MTGLWGVYGLGMLALAALLGAILMPFRAEVDDAVPAKEPNGGFLVARFPGGPRRADAGPGPAFDPRKQIGAIAAVSLAAATLAFLVLRQPIVAVLFGLLVGPALWSVHLGRVRRKYEDAFSRQFLPALDVIVRGLRSGMPLISSLEVVRAEIGGPVRIEFQRMLDDMAIGLSLTQAVERLAQRVPLTEVQFFSIVISIQSRTGGRLSEALENLAGTLRDRNQLALRIRTVSQEARTSAAIIAALPAFVMAGLFVFNPSYISVLFTHPLGIGVFIFCLLWMAVGSLVMKKMTEINA